MASPRLTSVVVSGFSRTIASLVGASYVGADFSRPILSVVVSGFSRTLFVAACLALAGCAAPHQISSSGTGAFEPSLAPLGHGFVASWYDTRDGNPEIYMRLLDGSGHAAAPERRLTYDRESSYEPDAIAAGGDVVIAWYDKDASGALTPRLGRWSRMGERRWIARIAGSGRNPVVRLTRDRLFVAWLVDDGDRSQVWGGWWNLEGQPLSRRVLADAGKTTWNLNAAVDRNGVPWVAFDAKAGTQAEELFLVRVDTVDTQLTAITPDDGVPSKYPDIAFNDTRGALTWYEERDGNEDVYAASIAGDHLPLSVSKPVRLTATPGESIGAYLAWNGSRVGVAWSDEVDGQHEVFLQEFDETLRPVTDARRITFSGDRSLIPAIKPWGNRFALLWTEYRPGADGGHGAPASSEVAFTLAP